MALGRLHRRGASGRGPWVDGAVRLAYFASSRSKALFRQLERPLLAGPPFQNAQIINGGDREQAGEWSDLAGAWRGARDGASEARRAGAGLARRLRRPDH